MGRDGGEVDAKFLRDGVRGMSGGEARRVGMRLWLDERRRVEKELPGGVWQGLRGVFLGVLLVVAFLAGIGLITGLLDRERMGFHVPMVLGLGVGLPLLMWVVAGLGWVLRGKLGGSFGVMPRFLGWLLAKVGGGGKMKWWREIRLEGGRGWEALGWNLVRMLQVGAGMFSLGMMAGLLGSVWFLEVSFFWEKYDDGLDGAAAAGDLCGFGGAVGVALECGNGESGRDCGDSMGRW